MNKNNTVLSIFTIIAVFLSGIALYAHQTASATTESNDDSRLGIQTAQEALERLNFPNASNETKANIENGQEGLANISSMLSQLNGDGISSPLSGQSDSGNGISSPLSGQSDSGNGISSPLSGQSDSGNGISSKQ